MSKKEDKTNAGSQIEVHEVSGRLAPRKITVLVFVVLTVLVLISAAWLFTHRTKTQTESGSKSTATAVTDFRLKEVSYEQSVSGNNSEIRKTATSVATTTSGKSADYVTAYGLAISSSENGDYKKALEQFEIALKSPDEKTYTLYTQVGLTYAAVGNNAKAVEYIKLAKTTYNNKQAALDSQELRDGINEGFDQQIAEYSK